MNFAAVEKIAAAILYEGYILYPYRKSAVKNRQRWNLGTLYPREYARQQRPQEPFSLSAEVLASPTDRLPTALEDAVVDVRISFLQFVGQDDTKVVQELADPSHGWTEAIERISEYNGLKLGDLMSVPFAGPLHLNGEGVQDGPSRLPVHDLDACCSIAAHQLADGSCRLHLELHNITSLPGGSGVTRSKALSYSFVSAHLLLGITGGQFVSLLDPSTVYCNSAAECKNAGVFPVLAGEEPDRNTMLCSPIILHDYPKVAPESAGDFFDGTEMDEMLALRVLTLSDFEKEEMRTGDARARRILERTESLTGEEIMRAHGVVRSMRQIREDGR